MIQRSLLNPVQTKIDASLSLRPRLGPINTKYTHAIFLSDGSIKGQSSRTWFDVGVDITGIRLVFSNFYAGDSPGPNPISVKAAVETTSTGAPGGTGTVTPVYFNGQRTVTIEPGGIAISDVVPVTLKKGQGAFGRTYVSVPVLGQLWPIGKFNDQGAGATIDMVTATDVDNIDTAGVAGMSSTWLRPYVPIAILGVHGYRTVLLLGDSIMAGEAVSPISSDTRAGGFGHRAFKNLAGVINVAMGSERSDQFISLGLKYRMQLAQFCTDAFCGYGNNDIHQGGQGPTQDFANVALRLQTLWALCASYGMRVHAMTITPRTTSTDTWATTTNQTLNANNALRVSINNWIRAGAPQSATGLAVTPGTAGSVPNPYIATISEVADAVESARDSGLWKINYTGDGTHPNATAAAAMAAAIAVPAILTQGPIVATGGETGIAVHATRAETAIKLAQVRNINSIPFDGSKDITIPVGGGGTPRFTDFAGATPLLGSTKDGVALGVAATNINVTGQSVPAGAIAFKLRAIPPGNGGGSGRRGAAGTNRFGGGGGGGVPVFDSPLIRLADIGSPTTWDLVMPTSGQGGAAIAIDDNDGAPGSIATNIFLFTCGTFNFRAYVASSVASGRGGTATTGTAGVASSMGTAWSTAGGASAVAGGGNGVRSDTGGGAGSGAGGGINNASPGLATAGGLGGPSGMFTTALTTGTAGAVDGALPTATDTAVKGVPGFGVGGGASSVVTAAQAGADGVGYGAPGGGGGASINGNNSGRGGHGGPGFFRIEWIYS